jgi:WD40 repeat protein
VPESAPHTDQYGDPLPPGAIARMGTLRLRHQATVTAVRYSPDGKVLASAGADGAVCLWEPATGRELRRLGEGHDPVTALAFSPDGRTLATANGDERLLLWNVSTGEVQAALGGHPAGVSACAFSPDGKWLATGTDANTIHLRDAVSGKLVHEFPAHDGRVTCLAFSRDGRTLASKGANGMVRVWEVGPGRDRLLWQVIAGTRPSGDPNGPETTLAFSPDGKRLVGTDGRQRVFLWEAATGTVLWRSWEFVQEVAAIAFSPDGRLVASASGQVIVFWEVDTGDPAGSLTWPAHAVECLAFSPDGRTLASGGNDGTVRLWDLMTGKSPVRLEGHPREVYAVAFSPDGALLATAGRGGPTFLWDAATGKLVRPLESGSAYSLAFSPDGWFLVAGGDARVHVWKVATGKETGQLWGYRGAVHCLDFSADGDLLASASWGGAVREWATATGQVDGSFEVVPNSWSDAAFSPDHQTLAAVDKITGIDLRVTVTGEQMYSVPLEWLQNACSVAFSPDGTILAIGGADGLLHLWDVGGQKFLSHFGGHEGAVCRVLFSPDGKTLASAGEDRTVRLWELATGKQRRKFEGHRARIAALAFSPDGTRIASGSWDSTAVMWDLTGLRGDGRPRERVVQPGRFDAAWDDLGGADAARAYQAAWELAAPGPAAALLRERLKPAAPADPERVARLIADLDDDDFAVRERATRELEGLAGLAEAACRKALAGRPPPEVRRRLEYLLEERDQRAVLPGQLQGLRAVEALEHLGSPEAVQLLKTLADGVPEARLTQEAKASLERLGRRPAVSP